MAGVDVTNVLLSFRVADSEILVLSNSNEGINQELLVITRIYI